MDLNAAQVDDFIRDGFVKVTGAFSRDLAAECRDILWAALSEQADDSSTWTRPVARLGIYSQPPFADAANTAAL